MQGLGNDFVVINAINQSVSLSSKQLCFLADRHFGVGCDQILLVEKAAAGADFKYRIFNADGGEVGQCGNGARCFVRYVHDYGLTQKKEIRVETLSRMITLKLEHDGQVTVNMGEPEFEPAAIPFLSKKLSPVYLLDLGEKQIEINVVSIGNPHAIRVIKDISQAPVATEGAQIESHSAFPDRVNVGYMQVIAQNYIKLRVYERGSGETLACGTGACAAVVIGIKCNLLAQRVTVSTRGGNLQIYWAGDGQPVLMTGSAVTVFEGEINL